jgi:hypothetical protein
MTNASLENTTSSKLAAVALKQAAKYLLDTHTQRYSKLVNSGWVWPGKASFDSGNS